MSDVNSCFLNCTSKAQSPLPSPLLLLSKRNKLDGSPAKVHRSSDTVSLLYTPSLLRKFAIRFKDTVLESASSFMSLFESSTSDEELGTSTEDSVQNKVALPFRRSFGPLNLFSRKQNPKLPFCEEYDGVNKRKTNTISESIVQLLESRLEEGETQKTKKYSREAHGEGCMASAYFDRLCVFSDTEEILDNGCTAETLDNSTKAETLENDTTEKTLENGTAVETLDNGTTAESTESNEDFTFESVSISDDSRDSDSSGEKINETNRPFALSKRGEWAKKFKIIKAPSIKRFSLFRERGIEEATIDLKIKYDSYSETLQVKVVSLEDVTNLRKSDKRINTYVQLGMYQRSGERKQKTKTAKQCRDPKFNQTFQIKNVTKKWFHVECLHVELYRRKRFKRIRLGEAFVWLDDLDLTCNDSVCITERLNPCITN